MTQSQSPNPDDRLARVEAALENQVQVNAEVRTQLEILKATAEALVTTSEVYQQNFEAIGQELLRQRTDIAQLVESQRQLQDSQRTTNSTLDRVGAILEYLVNQQGGGN